MDHRPIGIFDSGVGGLTVVSEVIKQLPNEDIIYFGDTARVPYGSKSSETVTKFSRQIVNFLLAKDVKAIILACNTVSSNSFEALSAEFDIPFVDVVTPGVEACINTTQNNVVGVIGTEATIRSGAYEKLLKERCPQIKVYSKACPLFVPLAEEGWTSNSVASLTTEIYLQELIDKEIDSILLGCTHYPLLHNCIKKTVGNIKIVNPAVITAKKMREYLINQNKCNEYNCDEYNNEETQPSHTFYVSDNTTKFNKICKLVLNHDYSAKKIDLEV